MEHDTIAVVSFVAAVATAFWSGYECGRSTELRRHISELDELTARLRPREEPEAPDDRLR